MKATLDQPDRITRLSKSLLDIESDRETSVLNFISKTSESLIDIAFMLTPEIEELLKERKEAVAALVIKNKDLVDHYVKLLRMEHEDAYMRIFIVLEAKLKEWRKVNHDISIKRFLAEINSKRFFNPEERIAMLAELKVAQEAFFNKRGKLLAEMAEIPVNTLSVQLIEDVENRFNALDNDGQQDFDSLISKLVNLQTKINSEADELLEKLRTQLEYFASEPVEPVLDAQCRPFKLKRKEEGQELLSRTIKYLEDTDNRSQEIIANLIGFWKKFGTALDENQANMKSTDQKHAIEIAARADAMDDSLENVELNIKTCTVELTQSVTYDELQQRHAKVCGLLLRIGTLSDEFMGDLIALKDKQQASVSSVYLDLARKFGKEFGILPGEVRIEVENKIKEAHYRAWEEERQKLEEKTKKPSRKVEEPPPPQLPTWTFWEFEGQEWVLERSFEEIVNYMYLTEEDRLLAIKKKEEELARLKAEEERKAAEEAAKRGQRGAKKPVEVKLPTPPPEIAVAEPDPMPVDTEGNEVLSRLVFFQESSIFSMVEDFRTKALRFLISDKKTALQKSVDEDDIVLSQNQKECDERKAQIGPRTTQLEEKEVTLRKKEIKKHMQRFERHMKAFEEREAKEASKFAPLCEQIEKTLAAYKEEQKSFLIALPNAHKQSELDGLLRQTRNAQQGLKEKETELIETLDELASASPDHLIKYNETYIKSLLLKEHKGDFSEAEVAHYSALLDEVNKRVEAQREERSKKLREYRARFATERDAPVAEFEKQYAIAMENHAAKEGLGKKYGAPRRSAQEKLRAEKTKCENAQNGIDDLIEHLKVLMGDYKNCIEAREFVQLNSRNPSLALSVRKTLLALRACIYKYGTHLNAFKEDVKPLKAVTWLETSALLDPAPEEVPLEAGRRETYLEPMRLLGEEGRPHTPFSQAVVDIERLAREECMKLFQGKGVPEFMEKFLQEMKKSAEEFRLQRIRLLRSAVMQLWGLCPNCVELTLRSVQLGLQYSCEAELEQIDISLMDVFVKYEEQKKAHQKALRPNLKNPSNRQELEALNKAEEERIVGLTTEIDQTGSRFSSTLKKKAGEFKVKLANHFTFLLLYFDNCVLEHDFKQLPGEEPPAPKRSSIRTLTRKKLAGKIEVPGPKGHKKRYTGIDLHRLADVQGTVEVSPAIETYKSPPYKAVFSVRSEVFESYAGMHESRARELAEKCKALLQEVNRWKAWWADQVRQLRIA
mmetsp:Transcript_32578/g.56428  ORF Transcript_32578/g.56428 Transcript_32578/m.56428 type:complete len:1232 (+) Transcript_32578:1221-4916(+)